MQHAHSILFFKKPTNYNDPNNGQITCFLTDAELKALDNLQEGQTLGNLELRLVWVLHRLQGTRTIQVPSLDNTLLYNFDQV